MPYLSNDSGSAFFESVEVAGKRSGAMSKDEVWKGSENQNTSRAAQHCDEQKDAEMSDGGNCFLAATAPHNAGNTT